MLIHLGFVLMGQQIQLFVPRVAGIVVGMGEAGPAMLCCQPGRAITVPEAEAGYLISDFLPAQKIPQFVHMRALSWNISVNSHEF